MTGAGDCVPVHTSLSKLVKKKKEKNDEQVRYTELSGIEPEAGLEPATLRLPEILESI
jgi:hypothetical protein